jgi:hypothetical protein
MEICSGPKRFLLLNGLYFYSSSPIFRYLIQIPDIQGCLLILFKMGSSRHALSEVQEGGKISKLEGSTL